jgi:hypothetical protein
MQFDFSRLRGRIVEKYGTGAAFAEDLGKSPVWLSSRLNGLVHWDSEEIYEAIKPERLDIHPEDISTYFFVPKFR